MFCATQPGEVKARARTPEERFIVSANNQRKTGYRPTDLADLFHAFFPCRACCSLFSEYRRVHGLIASGTKRNVTVICAAVPNVLFESVIGRRRHFKRHSKALTSGHSKDLPLCRTQGGETVKSQLTSFKRARRRLSRSSKVSYEMEHSAQSVVP